MAILGVTINFWRPNVSTPVAQTSNCCRPEVQPVSPKWSSQKNLSPKRLSPKHPDTFYYYHYYYYHYHHHHHHHQYCWCCLPMILTSKSLSWAAGAQMTNDAIWLHWTMSRPSPRAVALPGSMTLMWNGEPARTQADIQTQIHRQINGQTFKTRWISYGMLGSSWQRCTCKIFLKTYLSSLSFWAHNNILFYDCVKRPSSRLCRLRCFTCKTVHFTLNYIT